MQDVSSEAVDLPDAGAGAPAVGLLAGGGGFPFHVARRMREQGYRVVCAAVRHQASGELAACCDRFRFFGVGRLGAALRFFRRHGVTEVSWAGWIRKEEIFKPWRLLSILPDWRLIRLFFFRLPDRQSQTILAALADEFAREGIAVSHSAKFCPELLAEEGVLTRRKPSAKQLADVAFGWNVCRRLADLDVGQSVAVCERSTIAAEGLEGTDRSILRAGELYPRGGFVVVKLAKEGHDMRFDVPAVGPRTIESMRAAGGAVLAIEAGRTLILEREAFLELANRHGIVVVALGDAPSPQGTTG